MNRIKQLRLSGGMSLDDLARSMGGCVSKQALSKHERGLSKININCRERIKSQNYVT
jgi:transcriptional regulator with XRE-family HTH domain